MMEKNNVNHRNREEYQNQISNIYSKYVDDKNKCIHLCKSITFQVTEDCNLSCTYCYQINKSPNKMMFDVAKKCIDSLFENEKLKGYISFEDTKACVLDFIGGEPLLEVDLIDRIVDYFVFKAVENNHPWAYLFRISISSNGTLYFNDNVQKFIKKYKDKLSLNITIDGNKEIHDTCRIFKDSKQGSYDVVSKAIKHYFKNYQSMSSKVTLSPENIHLTFDAITHLIEEFGYDDINANCVFEEGWNVGHAKIFYRQLKKLADYLIDNDLDTKVFISLFDYNGFSPMDPKDDQNFCGGAGLMLAFDYKGDAYPCIRFMKSSLGENIKPIKLGSVYDGILEYKEHIDDINGLSCITRKSQSTDECFNCPIAKGCAWCTGYNYQRMGSYNKRATFICIMHKARSLANAYFFNKAFKKYGVDERLLISCPDEWALEIIDNDELSMLKELSKNGGE